MRTREFNAIEYIRTVFGTRGQIIAAQDSTTIFWIIGDIRAKLTAWHYGWEFTGRNLRGHPFVLAKITPRVHLRGHYGVIFLHARVN